MVGQFSLIPPLILCIEFIYRATRVVQDPCILKSIKNAFPVLQAHIHLTSFLKQNVLCALLVQKIQAVALLVTSIVTHVLLVPFPIIQAALDVKIVS